MNAVNIFWYAEDGSGVVSSADVGLPRSVKIPGYIESEDEALDWMTERYGRRIYEVDFE